MEQNVAETFAHKALHARIGIKTAPAQATRKACDSYLERLGQFTPARMQRPIGEAYLRRFAQRGASAL